MSDTMQPQVGTIVWTDLTVENAEEIADFYGEVVGLVRSPHSMGEYDDYVMSTPDGTGVTGVCHARGTNANVPPQWLTYFSVENVERSAARCVELGGRIIDGPRKMGHQNFCVIQDPAGAIAAIIGE